MRVPAKPISLDDALEVTRTGDVWLYRGRAVADRAIQISTNSPINHVGMSVALDDLPPLMWHAELGRSLPDRLYLTVLVLWVPVYLAMYRHLERTRPAPALVGSALGTLGLGVLAAGAIPHAATSRLSDLYHAAGATAEDQATLVLVWQGTQGIFDALLLAGLLVTATGIVLLGLAMQADPAFGKGAAWLSMLLGTAALAAGIVVLIDPTSSVAALGIFALIGFHLILGWQVYRLSKLVRSTHGRWAEPGTTNPVRRP